jgi:hypothetical protein
MHACIWLCSIPQSQFFCFSWYLRTWVEKQTSRVAIESMIKSASCNDLLVGNKRPMLDHWSQTAKNVTNSKRDQSLDHTMSFSEIILVPGRTNQRSCTHQRSCQCNKKQSASGGAHSQQSQLKKGRKGLIVMAIAGIGDLWLERNARTWQKEFYHESSCSSSCLQR